MDEERLMNNDSKSEFPAQFLFKPILIVGFPNSGMSLLARLLHQAGTFAVSDRKSESWKYFDRIDIDILPGWNDPDIIRRFDPHQASFGISALTIADVLCENGYIGDLPWVWANPRAGATIQAWVEAFPEASVVHVIRDPLDAITTLGEEFSEFTPGGKLPRQELEFWGRLWVENDRRISKTSFKSESFVEVRYEALCCRPHQELGKLMQFLDLPEVGSVDIREISARDIGIYRKLIADGLLRSEDVKKLKTVLGDSRTIRGYTGSSHRGFYVDGNAQSSCNQILTPVM
ncbi:hypothetical protein CEE37_07360 [candidate division LCP-89 bacterium B3_LCP]|uniref:Sulfotransferase family protein n=1 Tax=candidate division LCP-89 bacterium B3_LCP TaxID=2012998 RepID=A0A532V0N6_UNCL8|nr:MAG: hypothetical protein CEE37_07360 [candidate division LCP-89 bacterium B3_LCP]